MAHLLFVIDTDPDNPVSDEDIEAVLQPDPHERVCRVTDPNDASMEALFNDLKKLLQQRVHVTITPEQTSLD